MATKIRFFLILMMLSASLWASSNASSWYTLDSEKKVIINVELFLSSTCPHCEKADAFFREIEPTTPWLHVQRYIINKDKNALIRFNQLLNEQQMDDFAVPSVFFCNSRWVGYANDETTGKDLLKGLNYCKLQIEKKGELSATTISVLKHWANANLFDSGMVEHPSTTHYITVIALLDAGNPCALFTLAAFLALLFIQDKAKDRIIIGSLFILMMGVVHFIQQAYTNSFFEWLPWLRWPAALAGLFTFYLVGQHHRKRSTHYSFIFLAFLLAIMVQAYQQTCLMNWSLIFEQWLHNQQLSTGQIALYQLVYQSLYLLPLLVIFMIYSLLIRTERGKQLKQFLNSIGLLYLMGIALFLIVYPLALSNLVLSLFTLFLLTALGLFIRTIKN